MANCMMGNTTWIFIRPLRRTAWWADVFREERQYLMMLSSYSLPQLWCLMCSSQPTAWQTWYRGIQHVASWDINTQSRRSEVNITRLFLLCVWLSSSLII